MYELMKKKVSLVLSGGGARGIAHIGVIEELEKNGYEVVALAGTSMGALVGGVYGLGKLEEFRDWMITLDKIKVFRLVDFTLGANGLVKADRVLNTMKQFVEDAQIEDLPLPYAAVATDILNKKEVVFREGSVYDAIRASIAIPSVITPVKTKDGLLADGGVLNNLPINRVEHIEDSLLVAVNVNADVPVPDLPRKHEEKQEREHRYVQKVREYQSHLQSILPKSKEEKLRYFEYINRTIGVMTHHMTQTALENNPVDVMIDVSKDSCGTYDFYKAEHQIELGAYCAQKALSDYEAKQG